MSRSRHIPSRCRPGVFHIHPRSQALRNGPWRDAALPTGTGGHRWRRRVLACPLSINFMPRKAENHMPKMSTSDLKAMLASEKSSALAAISSARLMEDRADAMDYYLGDMAKDMPAQDGRSRAVSTDVADTIEGLMPSLMDIFASSDDVVRFEPVGPEDEAAAQQETDYVNHVFMQQNPGFMILYSFIKDALLSKVGIVKVWWEEREEESRETYYDLTDDQFTLLAQAVMESGGAMKIVEHSVRNSIPSIAATEAAESIGVAREIAPVIAIGLRQVTVWRGIPRD